MSTCRACSAPIVFARTAANKLLPLDASDDGSLRTYPSDDTTANVAVRLTTDRGHALVRSARVLKAREAPLGDEARAMLPHFATCTCTSWGRS